MKLKLTIIFLAALFCLGGTNFFASLADAQSRRIKPAESPTPTPAPIPRGVYMPTDTIVAAPKTAEDSDVITVDSALVPIPVSIFDAGGQALSNLKIEDFELLIDGQTAEIGEISQSGLPVRLALLFDNSSSATMAREFEKKAAVRFFRKVLRPTQDLAALYSVATVSRLEQPLTKDVSQLVRAIENFSEPKGATELLDGIIEASNYLSDAQGRRVVVVVSDGEDTISDATLEDTVRTVQANNCQVYIVKTKDFENYKQTGARAGNANLRNLEAERRMQEIAAQTGGTVYSPVDERELDAAFAQISAELAQQYILSYYPENDRQNRGAFRAITINVKNRNDLQIRARKGYFTPRR